MPRRHLPTSLTITAAMLCACAAAGAAEWTPDAGGRFVLVAFSSDPEGAAVFVDGKTVCDRTPCSRNVPAGSREVTMRLNGHEPRTETVNLQANGPLAFRLDPLNGFLAVTSPVPGLVVSVDGVEKGRVPLERLALTPGPHAVVISSPCHHPESRTVAVERGKTATIAAEARPQEGALNVTAEDEKGNAVEADVLVDGRKIGVSPGVFKVSGCARELQLAHKGATFTQAIALKDQQVLRVAARLNFATPGATAIAAGVSHACAVTTAGEVKCWGDGYGTLPADAGVPGPSKAVAAGFGFTCALGDGGAVRCWGFNDSGQLGDGSKTPSRKPVVVKGLKATKVAAGFRHACAVTAAGEVACWGDHLNGQLGVGAEADIAICRMSAPCAQSPLTVPGLAGARAVSAGAEHSCAVLNDGRVFCWGGNTFGQVGDGTVKKAMTPVAVKGIAGAVAVSAGAYHTCAALADGTARCWGLNQAGRAGVDPAKGGELCEDRKIHHSCLKTPAAVPTLMKVAAIAAGGDHTCALIDGGAVACWGKNGDGRLGNGTIDDSHAPRPVKGLGKAEAIAAGGLHTCALLRDGSVACWGKDDAGVLGQGRSQAPDVCEIETETERLSFRCSRTPVLVKGVAGK